MSEITFRLFAVSMNAVITVHWQGTENCLVFSPNESAPFLGVVLERGPMKPGMTVAVRTAKPAHVVLIVEVIAAIAAKAQRPSGGGFGVLAGFDDSDSDCEADPSRHGTESCGMKISSSAKDILASQHEEEHRALKRQKQKMKKGQKAKQEESSSNSPLQDRITVQQFDSTGRERVECHVENTVEADVNDPPNHRETMGDFEPCAHCHADTDDTDEFESCTGSDDEIEQNEEEGEDKEEETTPWDFDPANPIFFSSDVGSVGTSSSKSKEPEFRRGHFLFVFYFCQGFNIFHCLIL